MQSKHIKSYCKTHGLITLRVHRCLSGFFHGHLYPQDPPLYDWIETGNRHAHTEWWKDMTSEATDNQRCKGASFPKLFQRTQNGNQTPALPSPGQKRRKKKRRIERKDLRAWATADCKTNGRDWCKPSKKVLWFLLKFTHWRPKL